MVKTEKKGEKGDKPNHKWNGTKLAFEKPNGEWGREVDLLGKPGKGGNGIFTYGGGLTKVTTDATLTGEGTTDNPLKVANNVNAVWGQISGTLSDQTDLQDALDLKLDITTAASTYVPYTGATTDVDLGNHSF